MNLWTALDEAVAFVIRRKPGRGRLLGLASSRLCNVNKIGNDELRGPAPQLQVPLVARPSNQRYLHEASVSGDLSSSLRPSGASIPLLLCACAAFSIAARLRCSSILSFPSSGVSTMPSILIYHVSGVRRASLPANEIPGSYTTFTNVVCHSALSTLRRGQPSHSRPSLTHGWRAACL